jgi:hypothetical protein
MEMWHRGSVGIHYDWQVVMVGTRNARLRHNRVILDSPILYLEGIPMLRKSIRRLGNIRWGCAAMLLGLPLPLVILAFLFGGCGGR